MNGFKIPTDNLYKFIAISGLIIIFSSFFFVSIVPHNLMLKVLDTDLKTNILEKETQQLVEEVKDLENDVDVLSKEKNQNTEKTKEFLTKAQQLDELRKKQEIKLIEVENTTKIDEYLTQEFKFFKWIFNTVFFIGLLLTCFGFYSWYAKLQQYQDLIIKNKSESFKK